jgi:hypothetical protein
MRKLGRKMRMSDGKALSGITVHLFTSAKWDILIIMI